MMEVNSNTIKNLPYGIKVYISFHYWIFFQVFEYDTIMGVYGDRAEINLNFISE